MNARLNLTAKPDIVDWNAAMHNRSSASYTTMIEESEHFVRNYSI